jgi:hypothetical protein
MTIFYTNTGSFNTLEVTGSGGGVIKLGSSDISSTNNILKISSSIFSFNEGTFELAGSQFQNPTIAFNGIFLSNLIPGLTFLGEKYNIGNPTDIWGDAYIESVNATTVTASGSLLISSSINSPLTVSGSVNEFFELEVVNASAGTNASADVVVSSNNTTEFGNYAAFGINSTTFNGTLVGGPSDGYLYLTSSVGELDIGHAALGANANVRLFAGGPNSTATTRVFISSSGDVGIGVSSSLTNRLTVLGNISASGYSGSFTGPIVNIPEMSMAVSGTIPANGTVGVQLNLNTANYFAVSASGTGTVTWTLINPPATGRAQTFIIEYTNGGVKTNSWFTNTRWPGGVAPSLTSASANPDLLGFVTDDAGANWRGVLLQRGSA